MREAHEIVQNWIAVQLLPFFQEWGILIATAGAAVATIAAAYAAFKSVEASQSLLKFQKEARSDRFREIQFQHCLSAISEFTCATDDWAMRVMGLGIQTTEAHDRCLKNDFLDQLDKEKLLRGWREFYDVFPVWDRKYLIAKRTIESFGSKPLTKSALEMLSQVKSASSEIRSLALLMLESSDDLMRERSARHDPRNLFDKIFAVMGGEQFGQYDKLTALLNSSEFIESLVSESRIPEEIISDPPAGRPEGEVLP